MIIGSQVWSSQGAAKKVDTSQIVTAINCLKVSPTIVVRVNGVVKTNAGHTNLGDPLDAAREMLQTQGRSDVPDIIIFMTDGQMSAPLDSCGRSLFGYCIPSTADHSDAYSAWGIEASDQRIGARKAGSACIAR